MTATLSIRLGEELARALEEEAQKIGVSKGEIVRQAVRERLQHAGNLSLMQRYFGVMQGPSDLSTNKAYRRTWTKKRA